ncbi:hypothetical protein GDO78_005584 [Eleutherodactylus coqui]|uniref:Uncharacterized protein n=1 Tax=Eleutherodactylus coqui TaxID=57060 RepID=A0A8J6FKX0_ELECQ|nr:hypothetical protein GDO78_005584 [Eleutherodactylus coqui]
MGRRGRMLMAGWCVLGRGDFTAVLYHSMHEPPIQTWSGKKKSYSHLQYIKAKTDAVLVQDLHLSSNLYNCKGMTNQLVSQISPFLTSAAFE